MDGERSQERSEGSRRRQVESAVLAIVLESHPERLPRSELLAEMIAAAPGPGRAAEVGAAVEGLVEVGLLVSVDGLLASTPASLRAGELELGL